MTDKPHTVLIIGATGSIGRFAVEESIDRGYETRTLVRNRSRAASLPPQAQVIAGDVTKPSALVEALDGIDAVVFTHGTQGDPEDARTVDYGAVRNVLSSLSGRRVRITLMTSIGVTNHGVYAPADWKRRGERLVRVSGLAYTIVRPGWFDYNEPDQHSLVMLQGDRRWSGTPADGSVSRRQIAQVLVASLSSDAAERKTLELVSERGPAQTDLEPLFSALRPDTGDLDAVDDERNLPVDGEPAEVRRDIETIRAGARIRG